jgi:hypothetical protein
MYINNYIESSVYYVRYFYSKFITFKLGYYNIYQTREAQVTLYFHIIIIIIITILKMW